ncbi:MAG TPA: BON domain-containing protein [Nitrososphaera sp.]|nr:BON domain-containing protein [Nitrososphaera sp.]
MIKVRTLSLTAALLVTSSFSLLYGQDTSNPAQAPDNGAATAPDNSKTNQRDRSASEPTAQTQKSNKPDRELARQVRRALVKDKSLSTYAHNVKVIVQDGMVTLKGPVRSQEEKQAIEAKAAAVAGGADKVKSEIDVSDKQANQKPSPAHTEKQ